MNSKLSLFTFGLVRQYIIEARVQTKTRPTVDLNFDFDTTVKNAPALSRGRLPDVAPNKVADKAKTQAKTNIALDRNSMRHMMDLSQNTDLLNIGDEDDTDVGYDEPVPVTPQNLPAIINKDILAVSDVEPEWHMVKNLPGYLSKPIRALGRQVFAPFTSTKIQDMNVLANLAGQGPNEERELNAVAGMVSTFGVEQVDAELEFSRIMPGYKAEVKIYEYKGYAFMLVRDHAGHYIYSWPSETSLLK